MTVPEFEHLLSSTCDDLTEQTARDGAFPSSKAFETQARRAMDRFLKPQGIVMDFEPHPHVFPDIVIGEFGVEVKYTANDTWRSVANSVFESTRDPGVKHVYVLFGKMGGKPGVRWDRYEDAVIHVRTSHVPRFEVEMMENCPREGESKQHGRSLFRTMGLSYDEFIALDLPGRMEHIRKYARGRLKPGERLWWLEDSPGEAHSLPLQVRLFMRLPQMEKRRLRAEAALLCPQIVKSSRSRGKYDDAVIYLLTYHGVLCPQARDLFSAGSVALRADATRGGNYLARSLLDIEAEMREAAASLPDALFEEYWGKACPPEGRIKNWLVKADQLAADWQPSKILFKT